MFHARNQKSRRKCYFFFSDSVIRLDELRLREPCEITMNTMTARTRIAPAIANTTPRLGPAFFGGCIVAAGADGTLINSRGGATFVGAASTVAGTALVSGTEVFVAGGGGGGVILMIKEEELAGAIFTGGGGGVCC